MARLKTFSVSNTGTGSVDSVAMAVPSVLTISGSPITSTGTFVVGLANQAPNRIFAGPASGSTSNQPTFRAAVPLDLAATPSAGQFLQASSGTAMGWTSLSGDATLSAGVLTLASVIAASGPIGGAATVPVITFDAKGRLTSVTTAAITPAGIGAVPTGAATASGLTMSTARLLGRTTAATGAIEEISVSTGLALSSGVLSCSVTGTVTSVDVSVPTIMASSGGPITGSGTIGISLNNQSAGTVWAGPATGVPLAPTFRALVATDIPALAASKITSGLLATNVGGTGLDTSAAGNGTVLIGNGSGLALATLTNGSGISITNSAGGITIAATGGTGTVTSVDVAVPGIMTSSGGPVTSSGVITLALATQSPNLFWAGPASGVTALAPTFRALVPLDLSASPAANMFLQAANSTTMAWVTMSGDATLSSGMLTLASVISAGGPTGSSSVVPVITYDAKGRLTAVTTATVTPAAIGAAPTGAVTASGLTMSTNKLLGRSTAATGAIEEIAVGSGLTLSSGTLTASGAVSSVNTRTGAVTLVATDIPVFIASGASHAVGTVPDPGASAGTTRFLREDATWVATGTVTSVAMTVPSILAVSGTPITSAGTLAVTLATQTANLLFAGPSSGSAATPTFRAAVPLDLASSPSANQFLQASSGTVMGWVTLSGDATLAGGVLTLAGTISAAGPIGSSSVVPVITYDAKGRLTTVTTATITPAAIGAAPTGAATASGLTMSTNRLLGRTTASTGAIEEITVGSGLTLSAGTLTAAGGSGTVTSVAMTVPSILSVSGSPITTSGTLAVTLATQTANTVFAGPTSGVAATPTFRALVAADLPVFVASGASHAAGAVPDPGSSAGTTRFLREDATFAVPQASYAQQTLTAGATVATDLSIGTTCDVTVTQAFTLSNPTNPTDGMRILWRIKQDTTGGWAITFGTKFHFGTDLPSSAIILSTAASTTDVIGAVYRAASATYDVVSFVKGF